MALVPTSIEKGHVTRPVRENIMADVNSVVVSSPGGAATLTITPGAVGSGLFILVERVDWSYSAAPTGGRLTVTDGTLTFFDINITAAGPGFAEISRVITLETNAVLVLAAPGGAVVGKLNVGARYVN